MNQKGDIFFITIKTPTNEKLRMKHFKDGRSICPVCGSITFQPCSPAWEPSDELCEDNITLGYPSFDICNSCNTQFGLDDYNVEVKKGNMSVKEAWSHLRKEWLHSMKRLKKLDKAIAQLKNIDLSDNDIKAILDEDDN
jgi:hypothetical protein